jgi:hypothetical protein
MDTPSNASVCDGVAVKAEISRYWRIDGHERRIFEEDEDDAKYNTDVMNEMLVVKCIAHPFEFVVYNEIEQLEHNHDSDDECDEDDCVPMKEYRVFALLELTKDALSEPMLRGHFQKSATSSTLMWHVGEWLFTPLKQEDYTYATRKYHEFRT